MKIKTFLVSMFACLALVSCNNEDEFTSTPPNGSAELDGGFITIDIPKPASGISRATESGPTDLSGLDAENNVSNVYIVTFTPEYTFANSYKLELTGTETDYLAKTKAIKLNKGAKYMFAILNAPQKVINRLNTASNTTTFDDIKSIMNDLSLDEVKEPNKFTMVSAGDLAQTEGSNGLTLIGVTYKTEQQAEEAVNRKNISVDRIVAKYRITGLVPTTVKGGTYTQEGWALNVSNKATTLYSELIRFGGTDKTPVSKYRKDHNWSLGYLKFEETTDMDAYKTEIDKNFNVLYNTEIDNIKFNIKEHTGNEWEYIFENTMKEDEQLVDRTTNIIFKANYRPNLVSSVNAQNQEYTRQPDEKETYFKYSGKLYDFAGIDAIHDAAYAIVNDVNATEDNKNTAKGIVADFDEIVVKILGVGKSWEANVNSLADINKDNAGNLAELCKLRIYWKGTNFYRGVIKHDNRLGTMALGKFGVVRNNAYSLSVESISGTGEPWIPGPTIPEGGGEITPDEESDSFIAVKITVNNWTSWSQGFDM